MSRLAVELSGKNPFAVDALLLAEELLLTTVTAMNAEPDNFDKEVLGAVGVTVNHALGIVATVRRALDEKEVGS